MVCQEYKLCREDTKVLTKPQREAQAKLGCERENRAVTPEEQCLIHTQTENDPYRNVCTSGGTE